LLNTYFVTFLFDVRIVLLSSILPSQSGQIDRGPECSGVVELENNENSVSTFAA